MKWGYGRCLFGAASIIFGLTALISHDLNIWEQIGFVGDAPYRPALVALIGIVQLAAGIAVLFHATARSAAVVLAAIYLFFAASWIPNIVRAPASYNSYGNFFEQFALFTGAWLIYGMSLPPGTRAAAWLRAGRIFFGVCAVSFTLEQAIYLHATARFVPAWIPFGPMFWAVTTTVAFGLAAVAILSGMQALLAARLTTAMIAIFQLLIWLPALVASPRMAFTWAGNAENLGIAAAAWLLCEALAHPRAAPTA